MSLKPVSIKVSLRFLINRHMIEVAQFLSSKDKLNISSLDYTVSGDLKVLLQMVRKQTATSKHPCLFCMTSSPDFQKANYYTLESLCRLYDKWIADGAKFKKQKSIQMLFIPLY